ncbi:MAG: hypothetical protein Q7S29_00765 [Candidatus Peribacter sp.]|nr:hypothetical protein [Candidatus Peribacter sp.]
MKKLPFFAGVLLPFAMVAAFQWTMDPTYIFGNRNGNFIWWNQPRISIAFVLRRMKVEGLTLGSSRADTIPLVHPAWSGLRVMKIVLPSATFTEERQFLEHAQAIHPIKKIIVEMSHENVTNPIPAQFSPDRLLHLTEPNHPFRYNLSIVTDVARTLYSADTIQEGVMAFLQVPWTQHLNYYGSIESLKKKFGMHADGTKQEQKQPMEELKKILEFGAEHDIEMHFFISPLFVPYEEQEISRIGIDTLEKWKRDLVRIFAEVARKKGKTAALWDFSGYNTITLVPMPASGDIYETPWFSDISHFKEVTGTMILDRIFGTCREPCTIPPDFGVQLTPENIEERLAKFRADHVEYLETHKASAY